jgi:hypothetical protein
MSRRFYVIVLLVALIGWTESAYSQQGGQSGAQATASTQGNAAVKTDRSGAKASGSDTTSASAQAGQNSASLNSGTTMNAVLTHPVDAKKNKPGDSVTAKTTESARSGGEVIIPKGSTLVGHVTQAQARGRGEVQSTLGIMFDRAVLKNGQEVPLNMNIRAIADAESAASSSVDQDALSAGGGAMGNGRASTSGGGGLVGGVASSSGAGLGAVGNTAGSVGGSTSGVVSSSSDIARNATGDVSSSTSGAVGGTVGGLNTAGQLTSNSHGVFGLHGLGLTSAASSDTQGSLITSTSRNVHLESGTRLLLAAEVQTQASRQ